MHVDRSQDNREEISCGSRQKTSFDDDDHRSGEKEGEELGDEPSGQEVDLGFCLKAESADERKQSPAATSHGRAAKGYGLFGVGRDKRADSQKENDESDEVNDFVNAWRDVCVVVLSGCLSVEVGDCGEEFASVVVLGIEEDFISFAVFHDLAGIHHRDVVGDVSDNGEIVGDEDHGEVQLVAELEEQVEDL